MTAAAEIQVISPELCVWQAYEPAVKCDCTSTAMRFGSKLIVIDPIPLNSTAADELEGLGTPELIVCTSGNHARAAEEFRKRYGAPIAAHPDAQRELGFEIDVPIRCDGEDREPLRFISLPGAASGEIALYDPRGILCLGDAVIHLPVTGFALLPDKYCADAKLLRSSLRKLLPLEFRVLTFAHGWPLTSSAHEQLAALLS
jgi:glyoxylase-like metal-dependent hydrolase (beta-lactamase superfamily II)